MTSVPIVMAVIATAAAPIAPLRTFSDWIVGCDNTGYCQAIGLGPEDLDDPAYLETSVTRAADFGKEATLAVSRPDGAAPGAGVILKSGDAVVSTSQSPAGGLRVPLTRPLIERLLKARTLGWFDEHGVRLGGASLEGLAASLRFMDAQQKRAGTTDALVAVGSRPGASIPGAGAAPLVTAPAPSTRPPRTVSVTRAKRLLGSDEWNCDKPEFQLDPKAWRLDAAHSVVLVDSPCLSGAYNLDTHVYVVSETGVARKAQFDAPPGRGAAAPAGELDNAEFDARSHLLTSFGKGRGLGDCGSALTYAWDGDRFRLTEQDLMTVCRGARGLIRTWTARVVR